MFRPDLEPVLDRHGIRGGEARSALDHTDAETGQAFGRLVRRDPRRDVVNMLKELAEIDADFARAHPELAGITDGMGPMRCDLQRLKLERMGRRTVAHP